HGARVERDSLIAVSIEMTFERRPAKRTHTALCSFIAYCVSMGGTHGWASQRFSWRSLDDGAPWRASVLYRAAGAPNSRAAGSVAGCRDPAHGGVGRMDCNLDHRTIPGGALERICASRGTFRMCPWRGL